MFCFFVSLLVCFVWFCLVLFGFVCGDREVRTTEITAFKIQPLLCILPEYCSVPWKIAKTQSKNNKTNQKKCDVNNDRIGFVLGFF